MIKRYLQNLTNPHGLLHSQPGESHYLLSAGDPGIIARATRHLRDYFADLIRRQAREAEIRAAIDHLRDMNDAQLRDMGIARADIARAVRFGKENI